jgi:hypothetical protein
MTELTKITMPGNFPEFKGVTPINPINNAAMINKNSLQKMQSVVGHQFSGAPEMFDERFPLIENLDELKVALTEVVIRFDNDPRSYSKKDYYYLIMLLSKSLIYLYKHEETDKEVADMEASIQSLIQAVDQLTKYYNEEVCPAVTDLQQRMGVAEAVYTEAVKPHLEILDTQVQEIFEKLGDLSYLPEAVVGIKEALECLKDEDREINAELEGIRNRFHDLEDKLSKLSNAGVSAGSGIVIDSGDNGTDIVRAATTEVIEVKGVNIGKYESGDTIPVGTNIVELLQDLLSKNIYSKMVDPTVSISPATIPVEYGSDLSTMVVVTLTDGKFVSEDPEVWNYEQPMQCTLQVNSMNNEGSKSSASISKPCVTLAETLSFEYSISKSVNGKADNDDNECVYPGTSGNISVTIAPYRVAYVGNVATRNIEDITWSNVQACNKHKLQNTGITTIAGPFNNNNNSYIIAYPEGYKMTAIEDDMFIPYLDNFAYETKISGPTPSGVGTMDYIVKMYPLSDQIKVLKNLKIQKV